LEEQLQQGQKMEAIGRLAGGIAHDFNNALTIILTCSELLLRRYLDDPAQAREYVEEIKEAGERTALLTRQLLAFSRKQVMLPRLINLSELIQNLERLLRRLIGEDVLLNTTLKQDIGLIKADPSQLEQVIMNLVVNARDAMPTGGKLLIETKSTYLDEQYAQQRVGLKAGPYSVLTVSDTGGGIDKETIARIFEPFFTTKAVGKGTGLGLAMVYGIVQQSGGEIQVYSEPGLGTTFKVYLPQVHQSATAVATHHQQQPLRGGTETILVVEDDVAVRGLIDNILTEQGYTILKAGDGEEAIHINQQHEDVIHLLLTDVIMPRISGLEVVQTLTAPSTRTMALKPVPTRSSHMNGRASPPINRLFCRKARDRSRTTMPCTALAALMPAPSPRRPE
jgi:two-component sensor histidine kinase